MQVTKRGISSLVNNEAKEFAMYTIEERALPSMVDGLKPVQRYILYSVLKNAGKSFKKNAAIAGVISEYGYNHGEVAAMDAACLMASTWNNNFPIIQGQGNFGSRAVQEGAAARYIFCTKHDQFDSMFKDMELLEESTADGSELPRYYLPILPTVLLNGVSGIATGFATKILPHSLVSVAKCVEQVLKTGKCDEPQIQFPLFYGKITPVVDKNQAWTLEGCYELSGKTKLTISEIPVKYDRVKYVTLLDKLVETDKIVGYDESKMDDREFCFKITLKRDFDTSHENIIKTFKLAQNVSQYIRVIDQNGDLKPYEKASDLIVDFVNYRFGILQKRIDNAIVATTEKLGYAQAKVEFIKLVLDEKIKFHKQTRKQVIEQIQAFDSLKDYAEQLVQMNLYHMTEDELTKLEKQVTELTKENDFWKNTSPKKQYQSDIKEFLK
ncbi:topoisomerase II medium subunit [Aeromonas phage phiAS5]|uniref:DNA topoisomerase (ATP-hydrolyzing) n=1 Tax=Aeromonas phage phiAS5 TaxID=879630 RepID=E1A2M1_9CAUD|nr:DNA topoisomerase II [Aeromonas phage phiAS5]ADM79967.1 topoisomerase II medium subunit [Aeromonas phage phiAS5]